MATGRVEVSVAFPYPVVVGAGLDLAETLSGALEPTVGAILTDSNVGPLHATSLQRSLECAGWRKGRRAYQRTRRLSGGSPAPA